MFQFLGLAVFTFTSCHALLFPHGTRWNNLKVKWGVYSAQPLTESDAKAQGFKQISDCGDSSGLLGRRYMKNNDSAVILIYDIQGHIAGISASIPDNPVNGWLTNSFLKNHPLITYGNHHHMSVYFVNPSTICTTGRSTSQYKHQGVGTDLYVQNGTDPVAHSIKIPHQESGITATQWTRGKCFPTMGVHYWYNSRKDMSCHEFFPMFLLYNGGQLNAFGWAFMADFSSHNLEHPPKDRISAFMNPVPDCLYNAKELATQHIYLTNNPLLDTC